jgi:hypothetical protein
MSSLGKPPSTQIISFRQRVLEVDPHWQEDNQAPWVYGFSNGRKFYQSAAYYLPVATEPFQWDTGWSWDTGATWGA